MPDKDIFATDNSSTVVEGVVNSGTSNDPAAPLATLVGEGRKYRTVDELAKAYLSADEFLERIKSENAELREKVSKAKTIDDVLERIKTDTDSASTDRDEKQSPSGLTATDVQRIVSETISSSEGMRQREGNLKKADAAMRQLFGEKATEMFAKEASTPEMRKALMDLAAVSPDKFVALFAPAKSGGSNVDVTTSINTSALTGASDTGRAADEGCKEFYDNLRRKEPAKYYSQSFQLQMNKAATANPNKFFGR